MPKFLEEKLKKEYGNNKHAIYGTMNKLGVMHGNKETKKGKVEEKKHDMAKKMKNPSHNEIMKFWTSKPQVNKQSHREWKKANPRYNSHEEGESYSSFLNKK